MNVISLTDYIIDLEQQNARLSAVATEAVRQANLLHLENISLRRQLADVEREVESLRSQLAGLKAADCLGGGE